MTDEPDAWRSAGFHVTDHNYCDFNQLKIWLGDDSIPSGCTGWAFQNLMTDAKKQTDFEFCTIPTKSPSSELHLHAANALDFHKFHQNGVTGIDHIVISTNSPDWVEQEFLRVGVVKKKESARHDIGVKQCFYRPKDIIIEVISKRIDSNSEVESSAHIWGITFAVKDIDATHNYLKDTTRYPWDAVQTGRRITTLNTNAHKISTRIAFISPYTRKV